ncbi:MAG: FxsA family protein [Planctomycetales bacterium]|nr:FxsA family protein [Planctomycetales bacterium]
MFFRLLLLFIVVPLVELALLHYVAQVTSLWFTIGLVLVTGFVGTWLAKQQGWRVWNTIREELFSGRMPTQSMLDGVMILVAGALLLTPGILTDAFGLTLLVPFCRRVYKVWLTRWFRSRFRVESFTNFGQRTSDANHFDHRRYEEHSYEERRFDNSAQHPNRSEVIDSYVVGRSDEEADNQS